MTDDEIKPTKRDWDRIESKVTHARQLVPDAEKRVGDTLVVRRSDVLRLLIEQREELLHEFEALAAKFDASADACSFGSESDSCAEMDTYRSCARDVSELVAKLRG